MEEYIKRNKTKYFIAEVFDLNNEPIGSPMSEQIYKVIDTLPAEDVVNVKKAMEFIERYSFVDKEQVYTNGSVIVPLFRVKQALEDKAYNGFFEG